MFNYKIAKSMFMKSAKNIYKSYGFIKNFDGKLIRPTATGHQELQFQLKDYNNLSSSMEYGSRFDEIERLFDEINRSIPLELRGRDFDLQIQYAATVFASWNSLVGNAEWTFDPVDDIRDVESLVLRWHKRYQDTGEAFFSEFSSCDKFVDMHLCNSPKLSNLFYGVDSRIRFSGVMFLFAKLGKSAAIDYARKYHNHLQGDTFLNIERVIGKLEID